MKILEIHACLDCPFCLETLGDGPNYCKEMKRYFKFEMNESKEVADWCPLEDAQPPSQWISVEDILPEVGQEFLATDHDGFYTADDDYTIEHYKRVEVDVVFNWNSANKQPDNFWNLVTHWMPLPEPPEGG